MTKQKLSLIEKHLEGVREQFRLAKELQSKTITEARADYFDIEKDPLLSLEGKKLERAAMQEVYQKQFLNGMQKIKKDHTAHMQQVKQLAMELLAAEPEINVSDASIKAFDSALSDLKTRVLLHPMPDKAVGLIEDFTKQYSEPYFANKIVSEFHTLAAPLASSTNQDIKSRLSQTYDNVKQHTMTDDKTYAQSILSMADNPQLIVTQHDAPAFEALRDVIGREVAQAANDPVTYLSKKIEQEENVECENED
ncbi:hypothetical protein [Lysinibacillus xylanilyticus]|uniref:YdgA family protein n=1 Tax=Lysinibacillus xylanilyticus TaxID=582475 RepID=A0ABT4EUQ4_9BACI|nr:hypothetical protein [Lysinibacillus xylanilyticus]MCY9549407.1 YdgA family protein [Lysinibacillus xylanilyticus]